MFCVIALCLLAVASTQGATTVATTKHAHHHHSHAPGVTHEPSEKDNLRFVYDARSHQMVLVENHMCYVFTLSAAEQTAVHTDVGIRTLELKLLNLLTTATQTEVTMASLDKTVQHACGHVQHVYTMM